MKLNHIYYNYFTAVESAEELFLALARRLLELQEDEDKNQQELDYIDINTSEDNKKTQIEIRQVPCRFTSGTLEIINLFTNDDFLEIDAGTPTNFPFGKTSLLDAACSLGIYLADKELNKNLNPKNLKIFTYSFTSSRNLGDTPVLLTVSAREFPLEVKQEQAWTSTRAQPWLEGIALYD